MIELETLRCIGLFADLRPEHLETLARNLRPLHIDAGETLITENVTTRAPLLIVTDGDLEVTRQDAAGETHRIAVLEPPTLVGELEFLADVKSSATVKALGEVRGVLLPRGRFDALFASGEPAAYHLTLALGRVVSERLAETNLLLIKALAAGPERMKQMQNFDVHALSRVDAELEDLLK